MPLTVLSLCSGVGGLDLGIKLALPEARVVAYVEKDDYCRRVLTARMADGWLDEGPIYEDLREFDGREWRWMQEPQEALLEAGGCRVETDGPWSDKPASFRVAPGFPSRVDRLRALGNAVVPLVAAHALRTLAARIGEEQCR